MHLITGAAGHIGSHLSEVLMTAGIEVVPTFFRPTIEITSLPWACRLVQLNVTDKNAVNATLDRYRPNVIYHLAAQSLPTISWKDPLTTFATNVFGTVNIYEAIKAIRASGIDYNPMVVMACSSAEYGESLSIEPLPIKESAPLKPLHPYGVSKVAQDLLAYQYSVNDRIRSVRARIFNTTGPRKRNDVVSDFASRIAHILKEGGLLRVGNIETRRAILDVRDLVSALVLLAEKGAPGKCYNISGKEAFRIGDLIEMFQVITQARFKLEVDPALLRPSDEAVIIGDVAELQKDTGWRQIIPIEKTLRDTLEFEMALQC